MYAILKIYKFINIMIRNIYKKQILFDIFYFVAAMIRLPSNKENYTLFPRIIAFAYVITLL